MASAMNHLSEHAYRLLVYHIMDHALYGTKLYWFDTMGNENYLHPALNGSDHKTEVSMTNIPKWQTKPRTMTCILKSLFIWGKSYHIKMH